MKSQPIPSSFQKYHSLNDAAQSGRGIFNAEFDMWKVYSRNLDRRWLPPKRMILRNCILTGLFFLVNLIYCPAQSSLRNYLILDTVSLNIYKFEKLDESFTKIQALAQFDGNEYFIYLDNASDTAFSNPIRFFKPSIDSALFWNDICPLLDYMRYISGLDTILVYRYQWAIKKEAHDQAYIYCNPEYGLIALDLYHVGFLYYYEIPLIPKELNQNC